MPSVVLSSRQFGRYFGRCFPCRSRFASASPPPSLAPAFTRSRHGGQQHRSVLLCMRTATSAFTRRHKPRPGLRPRLSEPRRNPASCGEQEIPHGSGRSLSRARGTAGALKLARGRCSCRRSAALGAGRFDARSQRRHGQSWLASLRCPSPAAPFTGAGAPPSALTETNPLMPRLLEGAHYCFAWKARYGRGSPPNLRFEATSCPRS